MTVGTHKTVGTRKADLRTIRPAAPEQLVNDAPRVFTDSDFPVGSVAHQGDVILVRLADLPASAKRRKQRQIADGSTPGSRHVLALGASVYECDQREVAELIASLCPGARIAPRYIGPVFQTTDGKADLTHPEHGDHHYRGDMVIAVVFQRNLDAEEQEHRVMD